MRTKTSIDLNDMNVRHLLEALFLGVVLAGASGCYQLGDLGAPTQAPTPVPDGYYATADGIGYAFAGGLPAAFQGPKWACSWYRDADDSGTTYVCAGVGGVEVLDVVPAAAPGSFTLHISPPDVVYQLTLQPAAPATGVTCGAPAAITPTFSYCDNLTLGGVPCAAGCSDETPDGSLGAVLVPGCQVTLEQGPAVCVSSCGECS